MQLKHGVILDEATLHPDDLDLSALWATAEHWDRHDYTETAECVARVRHAEVIISNKVQLDAELLAQAPHLKLICIAATGTNNIDLEAAAARNIPVCNVTGYATPSVTEHVFALILALHRRLAEHQHAAREQWPGERGFCVLDYPMQELRGQTLGIIGYGELGHAVAGVAQAFGMQVIISRRPGSDDPRPDRLPLDEVLARADIVSLHCPLAPETSNLIDASALARMKPTALLINTARGGIVDEAALLSALQAGQLAGAALDVLATEPPAADHPLLTASLPNLIVTPHIAWASRESRQRLVNELVQNILAFQRGTARNYLTP